MHDVRWYAFKKSDHAEWGSEAVRNVKEYIYYETNVYCYLILYHLLLVLVTYILGLEVIIFLLRQLLNQLCLFIS
jgi:hypothetical protein